MIRRTLPIALLLVLCLVVSPVAAATDDETSETVALEPTSSYATLEDGELVLDFQRLNRHAVTAVDEVFEIRATNDTRTVWLESEHDHVRFHTGDHRTDELTESDTFTLAAGERESIGVTVDTRRAPESTGTVTVHARYADDDDAAAVALVGPPAALGVAFAVGVVTRQWNL